ncbi:MAG: SpoIIE family protein phosphatase [Bacteroidota bacterium]
MRILVADDDRLVRTLLNRVLKDWGHTVQLAEDGQEAWEYIQDHRVDCVISDWLMPNMNGVELCQKIRDLDSRAYVYTILLTSKTESADLVTAFEAGADDFVSKPVDFDVLRARIRAGERIVHLEQDLAARNTKLREANRKLEEARLEIQRDLEAGAALQRSLLPPPSMTIGDYRIEWMYQPHSVVSGDIFNVTQMDDDHIIFYLLDVSGHGVPSALLTVTVSKMLASNSWEVNPVINSKTRKIQTTGDVLRELNTRFQLDEETSQYFTIVYGVLNIHTGEFQVAQAGHPSPIVLDPAGQGQLIGEGGFPIGWMPEIDFDNVSMRLQKGGRLILYTDGISECANTEGEMYSGERLLDYTRRTHTMPLKESMDGILDELHAWSNDRPFDDDLSLLAIERLG